MSGSYSSCISATLYPSNSDSPFPWTPATVVLDFWPPPRPPWLLQRLCSRLRLSLLILGLNVLLLVAVCVIGSQRAQLQEELRILKENFSHFSSGVFTEMGALSSHGGNASDLLTSLEAKLEKQQKDLEADHATLLLHLKHFPVDLRILTCQMAFFRSNGTECCPVNWLEFEGSCYWFSRSGKTWPEAEKHCRLENAHLVVVNSREEQNFVQEHIGSLHVWMGLSDAEGAWKWVDGTDYATNFKNWRPGQPDDWHGHGLGGGEDCAHFHPDGWNDDVCQRPYRWVCEARLGVAG
uniref:asialoglycoprotein receptor 1-like isoform X3 n=1 Tax=Panthera onca TaxID=9690 RepID=UPI00295489D1|nr:asialoglycoprotein receptor 1-like isoform X3 [Panthera onca]